MAQFLDTSIEYLKGVGPKRADLLKKELHIFTFKDLILFFPFRYIDRSRFYKIAEIKGEMPQVQLKGKIITVKTIGEARKKRMVAVFSDGTGEIELVWFKGIKFLKHSITVGKELIVFGKPTLFNGKYNIAHPETEPIEKEIEFEKIGFQPVYSSTEKLNNSGLSSRNIWKLQRTLCEQISKMIPETLSQQILDDNKLIGREEAIKQLHVPSDVNLLKKALFRLKFEELFFLQLKLLRLKINQQKSVVGLNFNKVGNYFNDFYNHQLEFELTSAQKRVIKEIRKDCGTGLQMNRLLQGDVGSGKTIVAFMSMLMAIDNGFQACMMAPTEILAQQHYESISQQLNQLGLNAGLLTGSTKQSERKELFKKLENGEIHILIGTHALIEDNVKFKQLGLVVIDEQHKFGVAQRAKLWNKNDTAPHILIMTATPIPRTLAMTVYGDLDVSKIDEMPPGRKPIKTVHYFDSQRLKLFGFLEKEIAKGRQIYIVYPLIEESEKLDYKDLQDGYESIVRRFPRPKYQVSILHGKMKPQDKEFEMNRFVKGQTQIMVSTTVIEVGVNVPNASVMVIESAERFGLSQLHQLRGRVGRGADQSYCILMTSYKLSNDSKKRLETMVRTNDGFEIAEIDMQLRGPGDMEGTRQSGILNLKLSDLTKDGAILSKARDVAKSVLEEDENLSSSKNTAIRKEFISLYKNDVNWSRIS